MFTPWGRRIVGLSMVAGLLLFGSACSHHGSHSHPHPHPHPHPSDDMEPPVDAEAEPEPVAVTVFTEKTQLFMEYPRLVPGLEAQLLAHVTVLRTGEPVRSGSMRLELTPEDGAAVVLEVPEPKRDGLFIPVHTFTTPGAYQARIVVESDQVHDNIPVPTLTVYADLEQAHQAAAAEAGGESADIVAFLLEQQWKIGLLTEPVQRRTLTERLQTVGDIEAPHHAEAVVTAPLAGRLLAPKSGQLLHRGDRVEKGQIMAYLEPPLTTSDVAAIEASRLSQETLVMELMAKEVDLQTRILEIKQNLQLSRTRLVFARQNQSRIEALRDKNLGTVAELEAARRDVAVTEQEIRSSESLLSSLGSAQQRLASLRKESKSFVNSEDVSRRARHPLIAPISGEIVTVHNVEGEHIESQAVVYRLIDTSQVWIAAHISEFDLARLEDVPEAHLKLAAYPERVFDVLGSLSGHGVQMDPIVDEETRTLTLRYEVNNPDRLFRVGMLAEVYLQTNKALDALAIPKEALLTQDGQPIAYVLLDGETFQTRYLDIGIRDNGWVEVKSGIQDGERVVTRGAYLVKLAAMSPSSFGHSHVH